MLSALLPILFVVLVALGNLALGFWIVICLGRGPKSWDDLLASIARPIEFNAVSGEPEHPFTPFATKSPPPAASVIVRNPHNAIPESDELDEDEFYPHEAPAGGSAADDAAIVESAPLPVEPFGEIPPELNPIEKIAYRVAQLTYCCEANFAGLYHFLEHAESFTEDRGRKFAARFSQLIERHLNYLDTTLLNLQRLEIDDQARLDACSLLDDLSVRLNETQLELASLKRGGSAASLHTRSTAVFDAVVHACRETRDRLEDALLQAVAAQTPAAEINACLFEQSGCRSLGRLQIERTLALWKTDRAEDAPPNAAGIVDVDELDELNETFGPRAGNLLMAAIEHIARRISPAESVVGRLRGGSIFFLLPEHSADQAIQTAEKIRQLVEKSTFQFSGHDLRATVSGAAAEIKPEHDSKQMLRLLRGALEEAKGYGRNRTFIVDGEYSTLVVPPTFEIEPAVVTI